MNDPLQWCEYRRHACPICGHLHWCAGTAEGIVRCMRQPSARPAKNGGWIHRLDGQQGRQRLETPSSPAIPKKAGTKLSSSQIEQLVKQYRREVVPGDLARLAGELGVSTTALGRLGVGWDGRAWTFPMFDGARMPIGIQRRFSGGRKLCVSGSRLGLFISTAQAHGLTNHECGPAPDARRNAADVKPDGSFIDTIDNDKSASGAARNGAFVDGGVACVDEAKAFVVGLDASDPPLLVCEGTSDTAAALTLGYDAVGVPCAGQGGELVADFLSRRSPARVVIVADLDEGTRLADGTTTWPGIEGGLRLADRLTPLVVDLRFCLPPSGVKDLRAWLRRAGGEEVRRGIESAPRVHPAWLRQAWSNVRKNRLACPEPGWARRAAALLAGVEDGDLRVTLREQFEERAGIFEHDDNLPRGEAERLAFEELARKAVRS